MRRLLAYMAAALLAVGLGFAVAAVPPRAGQPHADQFEVAPYGNLAQYSPVNKKALEPAHSVNYALITMPGCSTGTVPADMQVVSQQARDVLHFSLVRNDSAPDFTIRANCGSEQIRICGAVNIFCLGRGFPYDNDVEISDIISSYYDVSRYAILMHEIIGHALAVWNEQYCLGTETSGPCAHSAQFDSTPNWPDIMNTGPNSRHLLSSIETERWERTMYPLSCTTTCWNGSRWVTVDGWSYDPSIGSWYDPTDTLQFGACNADHLRWSPPVLRWTVPGQNEGYDPALKQWVVVPAC